MIRRQSQGIRLEKSGAGHKWKRKKEAVEGDGRLGKRRYPCVAQRWKKK